MQELFPAFSLNTSFPLTPLPVHVHLFPSALCLDHTSTFLVWVLRYLTSHYNSLLTSPLQAFLCQSTVVMSTDLVPVPCAWRMLTISEWINFSGPLSGSVWPSKPFAWPCGPASIASQATCSSHSVFLALSWFYHRLPVSVSSCGLLSLGPGHLFSLFFLSLKSNFQF